MNCWQPLFLKGRCIYHSNKKEIKGNTIHDIWKSNISDLLPTARPDPLFSPSYAAANRRKMTKAAAGRQLSPMEARFLQIMKIDPDMYEESKAADAAAYA